jgi:hypothetical protein
MKAPSTLTELWKEFPLLVVSLFLLIFVACFFRTVALDRLPALNGDEAYTSVQMAELASGKKVDLYLPTHRTLSPLYGIYVWSIEKFIPGHSFWKVRLPSLLAGFLLVIFSFLLLRWVLPLPKALLASILIISSPVCIAYSRSAVEQSLMGLASLFSIYFALEGSFFSAAAALSLGAVIHPVNIFLLPVSFFPFLGRVFHAPQRSRRFKFSLALGLVSLSGFFVFSLLHFLPAEVGLLNLRRVFHFLWASPVEFLGSGLQFLLYFIRLYTGFSTFEYFSSQPPTLLQFFWDFLLGLTLLFSLFGLVGLRKKRLWTQFYYVLGFICMLFVFFFVAGPRALSVGLSRHGTFLIVPTSIFIAILIPEIRPRLNFRNLLIGFLGVGWIFLLHFYFYYFQSTIKTGGGATHRTYISGPVEPKANSFAWILEQSKGTGRILTEDWWIYWPIKYLALSHPNIEVIQLGSETAADGFDRLFNVGAFAMGFPDGPVDNHLKKRYPRSTESLRTYSPPSYANERALRTWQSIAPPTK